MNTDERTVTNVNEFDANVVNNECAEPKKRSTMWQNMSIGGVGGIALGVASSFFTIGSGHAAETPELNHLDLSAADIPVANAVNAEMSFEDAFEAARSEIGAGGVFEWGGKIYTTYTPEEWEAMPATERDEFCASLIHTPDEVAAEAEVTPEPASEVTPEPASEVTPEPASEVTPEPASEVTPEPASEVTPEPASEVTPEPTSEVTPEPTPEHQSININIGNIHIGDININQANDAASEVSQEEPQVIEAAPFATAVNDDMSFNQAFAAARAELGAGGVFEWHGKTYNTFYAEEWKSMSDEERREFQESIEKPAVADNHVVQNDETAADAQVVADVQQVDADDVPGVVAMEEDALSNDVNVIGVFEGNVEGQDVYVGAVEVDGHNVMVVDVDHDGTFDVAIADVDQDGIFDVAATDIDSNGIIDDNEIFLHSPMDTPDDMLASNDILDSDNLLSSDGMPDYMNDADVSMC